MNGSSFATDSFPMTSGFYGNTFWTPPQGAAHTIPVRNSAAGTSPDHTDPVFTEDCQVLATLNNCCGGQLMLVKSLFATAQAAAMITATIGKSGAAYIHDFGKATFFVDENTVSPRNLMTELETAGFALPTNVANGYSGTDAVTLATSNGNPTARAGDVTFNTTAYDPNATLTVAARDSIDTSQGAPEAAANSAQHHVVGVAGQRCARQRRHQRRHHVGGWSGGDVGRPAQRLDRLPQHAHRDRTHLKSCIEK